MSISIKAYANCDEALLVWQSAARIPNCRGFAVYRERNGQVETAKTWVGFQGNSAAPGTSNPSTTWPIQRFTWADYLIHPGDTLRYRVVPVLGNKDVLQAAEAQASDWSDPITVTASTGSSISAYFNRGVVATQWLARRLGDLPSAQEQQQLATIIQTPGDPTRNYLSGELRSALLKLLGDAVSTGGSIYAALFELNDPELIPALTALGHRANVILTNGSTQHPGEDENATARAALRDKINVYDRMLPVGRLGHNKFLVVCDASGNPRKAWTGSTNWTTTGLCTQANNGILVEDPGLAMLFKTEWDRLRAAANDSPPELVNANSQRGSAQVDGHPATIWFAPVANLVDLNDANRLINAAQQGVLFLMFNPGPSGTLLNTIVARSTQSSSTYGQNLYIHGVLNQDPGTTANPIVGLFHHGQYTEANLDVVLPEAINQQLAFWIPELKKLQNTWAMVHSKVIVLDPFGAHPVVMTGSHNLGPKASSKNDDNLLIVENDPQLAAAYAVNIMSIYSQYRWRFLRAQAQQAQATRSVGGQPMVAPPSAEMLAVSVSEPVSETATRDVGQKVADWTGLQDNDTWQDDYFSGAKLQELRFWLGQG